MIKPRKRHLLLFISGLFLGAVILGAVHFFTVKQTSLHYHANFGLFINGKRDEFKSFTFYEEVQSCAGNELFNPKIRTHMHDNVNYVAHVHDSAATWGHFFANLGYTLGNDLIETDDGVFMENDQQKLTFLLNGKPVDTAANRTINNKDVLLISYGTSDDATLQQQYDTITQDAQKYNETADPAACSGTKPLTLSDRLKAAVRWYDPSPTPTVPHNDDNHKD